MYISIMSVEIPYSFYNISSDLNNNTLVYDTSNTLTFERLFSLWVKEFFNNSANFSNIYNNIW